MYVEHCREITLGNGPQTRSSLHFKTVLVHTICVPSQVDSMTKVWVYIVYLGMTPGSIGLGGRTGSLYEQIKPVTAVFSPVQS